MVAHSEEYQKYLEERKIETCGFHLKEGEEQTEGDLKLNSEKEIQDSQVLSNFQKFYA